MRTIPLKRSIVKHTVFVENIIKGMLIDLQIQEINLKGQMNISQSN